MLQYYQNQIPYWGTPNFNCTSQTSPHKQCKLPFLWWLLTRFWVRTTLVFRGHLIFQLHLLSFVWFYNLPRFKVGCCWAWKNSVGFLTNPVVLNPLWGNPSFLSVHFILFFFFFYFSRLIVLSSKNQTERDQKWHAIVTHPSGTIRGLIREETWSPELWLSVQSRKEQSTWNWDYKRSHWWWVNWSRDLRRFRSVILAQHLKKKIQILHLPGLHSQSPGRYKRVYFCWRPPHAFK